MTSPHHKTPLKGITCLRSNCKVRTNLTGSYFTIHCIHYNGHGWLTWTCPTCRYGQSQPASVLQIRNLIAELPDIKFVKLWMEAEFKEQLEHPYAQAPLSEQEVSEIIDEIHSSALEDCALDLRDSYPEIRLS